jgi:hypothetical protein
MSGVGPLSPVQTAPVAPAEHLQATFEARELLLAMLGAGDPSMHERVLSVVRHAALAPVVNEAPVSSDDEVHIAEANKSSLTSRRFERAF